MPNLKLIGRLCLSEEGEIVYLPVGTSTRYKEIVFDSGQPSGIAVHLTPEEVKIAKETEADLSLTGIINANKKREESKTGGVQ